LAIYFPSGFKTKFTHSRSLKVLSKERLNKQIITQTWKKSWNINCKPSFEKPENVIKYLGQYTHRVAISNQRILNINTNGVEFMHKDYRNKAIQKPIFLTGVEFLRRFCQHILPKRFVKIRYYGIYSSRFKAIKKGEQKLMIVKPKEYSQDRLLRLTGFDVHKCPYCKKGNMQIIEYFTRIRSPGIAAIFNSKKLIHFFYSAYFADLIPIA